MAHKVALIFSPFLAIISFPPVVCGEAFLVFVVRTYKIFPLISLTLINHLKSIILSLPLRSQRLSIVISVRLWFFGSLLRVDGWQINMGMGIVTQFRRPTDNTVLCQTLTQLLGLEKKKMKSCFTSYLSKSGFRTMNTPEASPPFYKLCFSSTATVSH